MGGPIGSYDYLKIRPQRGDVECTVDVYLLQLEQERSRWPEYKQRKRKWVTLKKAVGMVDDPELSQIIRHFDPRHYRL